MNELSVFELYQHADVGAVQTFQKKVNSTLSVQTDYDKIECNYEWLDMMEDTVHYLDNILRNPNRFIINEEEIVKIELARRITVESIKHLSKNTNFIQDFNKKTGDVRPSKILNINKDESYDTYENRFIYTLIHNMKNFIALKKNNLQLSSSLKDNKNMQYQATTAVGEEKVNVSIQIGSKLNKKMEDGKDDQGRGILERIERLELQISDLTSSEVYKDLAKKHVALVMSPIKKTNVILKNVNFQYALKLWDYLQAHIEDDTKREKESKKYQDDGELKKYLDDSFLLNYLTISTLNKEGKGIVQTEEQIEEVTEQLIQKIVEINSEMNEEKLRDFIGEKIIVAQAKNKASLQEVRNVFHKAIQEYFDKINKFSW